MNTPALTIALAGVVIAAVVFGKHRSSGVSGDVVSAGVSTAEGALEDVQIVVRSLANVWPYPRGSELQPLFERAEMKYKMPAGLLAAQAWQESRFRADIISGQTISSAGAVGIMQIVPRWHPNVNPLNVPEAIDYAGAYDAALKKQFGTWSLALAAYNWGPSNLLRNLNNRDAWPSETLAYVANISSRVGALA